MIRLGRKPNSFPGSRGTRLTDFKTFCTEHGVQDLTDLHEFSVRQFRLFWRLLLEWAELPVDGSLERICTDDDIEAARFFPDLRLNYAEVVLAGRDDAPAVTAYRDNAPAERLMRSELREYVSRVAGALQALGVGEGDRVVAVARNDASTIVACLATAALGASFAIVDAEMSEEAILRRFSQLSPRVLFAHAREGKVAAVASSLPSLRAVITGGEALAAPAMTEWLRLPFNHPLFVSFSADASVIVHSAGGTLLEHVKEHRLHCDLDEGDRLFVQTSSAEMMWKWQLSALASGCEIILHDGPTEAQTLWRITAEHRVTHFVTTPGYLKLCEDRGYTPGRALDLSALRAVMSVGSSLRDRHYDWFARAVGRVPLEVMAGSDEILGCYALGSPDQPVCRGEAQSISLGLDLRVMPLAGETRPGIGQLVCATPIPSRPPGTRIEGDVIEITGRGSVRLYGHADSVIDIRGVSVIPADIYAALDGFPELAQMLAVAQRDERTPDGVRLVLMVTTRPGLAFTDEVTTDIRRVIGAKLTPVHVPAVIAEVAELPMTYGGELSEAAARAALNGEPASDRDALRNPACLEELARHPLLRRKREVRAGHVPQPGDAPIEARLTAIWEEVFGIAPLGPDADFFRLGGDSLTALSLMAAIEEATGQRLPTSVLMERHTVASLAELLREEAGVASGSVVRVRPGEGRPVFLVPGLSGTPLEAHQLLRRLDIARPIYVLPSRGFDGVQEPLARMEDIAASHIEAMRQIQANGPYAIIGFSFGGLSAYEMGRQLAAEGETVEQLVLLDAAIHPRFLPASVRVRLRLRQLGMVRRGLRGQNGRDALRYLWRQFGSVLRKLKLRLGRPLEKDFAAMLELPPLLKRVRSAGDVAFALYRPGRYPGRVLFLRATERPPREADSLQMWRRIAAEVDVQDIPSTHRGLVEEPAVGHVAVVLARRLGDGRVA